MRKGQITLEAAVIFVVCAVALVAMQGYVRRAIMGSWRNNADSFSDAQFTGDPATENVSAMQFIAPNMGIDINDDNSMDAALNIATESGSSIEILNGHEVWVNGWGTYYDPQNADSGD